MNATMDRELNGGGKSEQRRRYTRLPRRMPNAALAARRVMYQHRGEAGSRHLARLGNRNLPNAMVVTLSLLTGFCVSYPAAVSGVVKG